MRCLHCTTDLGDNYQGEHCHSCGKDPSQEVVCSECGTSLGGKEKCPRCGSSIDVVDRGEEVCRSVPSPDIVREQEKKGTHLGMPPAKVPLKPSSTLKDIGGPRDIGGAILSVLESDGGNGKSTMVRGEPSGTFLGISPPKIFSTPSTKSKGRDSSDGEEPKVSFVVAATSNDPVKVSPTANDDSIENLMKSLQRPKWPFVVGIVAFLVLFAGLLLLLAQQC